MTANRWRHLYPRAWRERYGEEYEQLLSDLEGGHLLPIRSRVDHYRFGLELRVVDTTRHRRLLFVAFVALFASGLGLFASTFHGSDAGSYVAPSLSAEAGQSVGYGYLDAQGNDAQSDALYAEMEALGPARIPVAPGCPALPIPRIGLGTSVASTSPPRTDIEVSAGNLGAVTYRLDMPTLSPSPSLLLLASELAATRVSFDRHWFAFCPEYQFFEVAKNLAPFPFLNLVEIGNEVIAFGFAASSSTIRLSVSAAGLTLPAGAPRFTKGPGALSFFAEIVPGDGCPREMWLDYDVLTPEYNLTGAEHFGQGYLFDCAPIVSFVPMSGRPSGVWMGGSPRSCGTVSSLSSNSLVLETPYWPPLHVSIPAATPLYLGNLDTPTYLGNNLRRLSWSLPSDRALARGESVYVSGTISTTTALASSLLVGTPCDATGP
jgi:hypothetical protein